MQGRKKLRYFSLLIIFFMAACGGGGKGGEPKTGVRLLHGILDIGALDLTDANGIVASSVKFSDTPAYSDLTAGQQSFSIVSSNIGGTPWFSPSIDVTANQRYSILVFGNQTGTGISSAVLTDVSGGGEVADGNASVKIINAVVNVPALDASIGSVSADNVLFGSDSGYQTVPAGLTSIRLTRSSDQTVIGNLSVELAEGSAYSVFATGEVGYFLITRMLEDN